MVGTRSVLVLDEDHAAGQAAGEALRAAGHVLVAVVVQPTAAQLALAARAIDVALVDPTGLPADAIRLVRAASPASYVLATSRQPTLVEVLACLDAGACGYVSKRADHAELARQVDEAACDLSPFSADVGRLLLPLLHERRGPRPAPATLTQRERQVLDLLANGHAYGTVADALGLGVGTVQSHVKNLYRKLDVSSKAEAVIVAVRQGLLTDRR